MMEDDSLENRPVNTGLPLILGMEVMESHGVSLSCIVHKVALCEYSISAWSGLINEQHQNPYRRPEIACRSFWDRHSISGDSPTG